MLTNWRKRLVQGGEWACYGAGLLCTGFFVSQLAMGEAERRSDIAAFESLQAAVAQDPVQDPVRRSAQVPAASTANPEPSQHVLPEADEPPAHLPSLPTDAIPAPDTTHWAPGRIADYQASLQQALPPVLGILNLPSLALELPVYSTDSDLTMDRGAGVIDGMAYPHEGGNIGIAGHRDGYFRALKDIQPGDPIVLQTLFGPKHFRVDHTQIIEIEDTHVLADTDEQRLTLVTCYPFYFVGHAPQRFVVTASLDNNYVNRN
ncbi:class D sortase [Parahaliea mediterranea]|uniref:class D sortase n=1 Tax=Parahaliea mediterranea TaxID=651086 RepID=UPI0019D4B858|nr:class D sortase [Parahaliea mediterranea]